MRLNHADDTLTLEMGEQIKIRLPGRAGLVTVTTHLATEDGHPRMRVDVESDSERYGPADNGLIYTVENGDPGPGVVFLTGEPVSRETLKGA